MSEFSPLHEQEKGLLPERPLLNLQLDSDFDAARFFDMRRAVVDFLSTDADVQACTGCPIPESLVEDIKLSLSELLANAQRPEAGRHATAIYVWAKEREVGVGVGDDSDTIAGNDQRPQTTVLEPDLGSVALDAYDENYSVELTSSGKLQSSGLGGSITAMLATRVSYSLVPESAADHVEEPRTHKIVRADFSIPSDPALGQAA